MEKFHEYVNEYKKQLQKGMIQKAYQGLMEYILKLRNHFQNKYPGYFISGSIYYGYMDMTYFSFIPESLKERKLKIAIVFVHEKFRFEVWLAGYNKQIQSKYWKLFKDNKWNKYSIVPSTQGVDAIVEHVIDDNPDFADLDLLTNQIETTSMNFIKDMEDFLSEHELED
jgi:hypothetical protein